MTDIQAEYLKLRQLALGHHAAVRELASRLGLDEATIRRVLARADRRERKGAKQNHLRPDQF